MTGVTYTRTFALSDKWPYLRSWGGNNPCRMRRRSKTERSHFSAHSAISLNANVYHSVVECATHAEEHPVRVIWALHGDHVLCLICLAPSISILRTPFKLAQHIFRRLHTVSRRSCTTYLGPLVQSLKQDTFEPHPLTDSGNLEYSSSGDSIITY